MTRVFQLFTDLKEAKSFCYNHNMKGIERLVLVKCGCHHTQDVYYVMDGMSEIDPTPYSNDASQPMVARL